MFLHQRLAEVVQAAGEPQEAAQEQQEQGEQQVWAVQKVVFHRAHCPPLP
jgi:hypothetical protein